MIQEDINILDNEGWEIECESPFEIRDRGGSFASGEAAYIVLEALRKKYETKQYFVLRRMNCSVIQMGKPETDIIGITSDEDIAKSRLSIFCYYEPVISLD